MHWNGSPNPRVSRVFLSTLICAELSALGAEKRRIVNKSWRKAPAFVEGRLGSIFHKLFIGKLVVAIA
jgi:hypothetical protein